MSALWSAWLWAFAVTQVVEVPIHMRGLGEVGERAGGGRRFRWAHRLWLAFAASALTHPFVYFGFPWLMGGMGLGCLLAAESFAVVVEAWWLGQLGVGRRDAVLWSLVANACSVGVASGLRASGLL